MNGDRGVALILALLVLSFISIVGGALLTTETIDIWITDNHKTAIQHGFSRPRPALTVNC